MTEYEPYIPDWFHKEYKTILDGDAKQLQHKRNYRRLAIQYACGQFVFGAIGGLLLGWRVCVIPFCVGFLLLMTSHFFPVQYGNFIDNTLAGFRRIGKAFTKWLSSGTTNSTGPG